MRTELIDKCVGQTIWVVMKGEKGTTPLSRKARAVLPNICTEFSGTLLGFDDYVSKYTDILAIPDLC
jgi:hypothetical protein